MTNEMVNKKIEKKDELERRIRTCLRFVKDIEYLSEESNLIYVKMYGGIGLEEIEELALQGLKMRFVNPIQITTKYGKVENGLQLSLEVLI
ncbi:MAG: hypothetical protein ACM3VV_08070 [Deltaproteobacteria bacterium]